MLLQGTKRDHGKEDRMYTEAAAERLNMVRERVRLHNELGGASEGIEKELADKLALSSSLCRKMRRRHRRARQRQVERRVALTNQQMPRNKKRRRYNRAARDAPTTTEYKAPFGKDAGEGGTSADLPRTDKARDQERERHGTPVELTRDEREKVGPHVENSVKDMRKFLKKRSGEKPSHSVEDAVLAAET